VTVVRWGFDHNRGMPTCAAVAQISANGANSQNSVFVLGTTGNLYEFEPTGANQFRKAFIASNVTSIAAVMPQGVNVTGDAFTLDNVYVQTTDGHVYEYYGGYTRLTRITLL
jgi:hypothetical protein